MTADPIAETAGLVLASRNARRLGRVRMASEFYEDLPDEHRAALGESVKSEWSWVGGYNEFLFRGPAYDIVSDGGEPPLYEVVMTVSENGRIVSVTVRRVDAPA